MVAAGGLLDSSNQPSELAISRGKGLLKAVPSGIEQANIHNSFDSDALRFDRPPLPQSPQAAYPAAGSSPVSAFPAAVASVHSATVSPGAISSGAFTFPALASPSTPSVASLAGLHQAAMNEKPAAPSGFPQRGFAPAVVPMAMSEATSSPSLTPRAPNSPPLLSSPGVVSTLSQGAENFKGQLNEKAHKIWRRDPKESMRYTTIHVRAAHPISRAVYATSLERVLTRIRDNALQVGGLAHAPTFVSTISFLLEPMLGRTFQGEGKSSKKDAEQAAALEALKHIPS